MNEIINLNSLSQDKVKRRIDNRENPSKEFIEKYDFDTLWYDLVQLDDRIYMVGPEMKNFKKIIEDSEIYIDNELISIENRILIDSYLTNRTYFKLNSSKECKYFRIINKNLTLDETISINQSKSEILKQKNILFTVNKNNDLNWIKDWAQYHIKNFEIDCIIIYDNNSNEYAINDISDLLGNLNNINSFALPINFKYGPNINSESKDIKFDSAFLQDSAFLHLFLMFGSKANFILNLDIDELLIANQKKFKEIVKQNDYVTFSGKWVSNYSKNKNEFKTYKDFNFVKRKDNISEAKKWIFSPRNLNKIEDVEFRIHKVINNKCKMEEFESDFFYYHFRGINTGWKWAGRIKSIDKRKHLKKDRKISKLFK